MLSEKNDGTRVLLSFMLFCWRLAGTLVGLRNGLRDVGAGSIMMVSRIWLHDSKNYETVASVDLEKGNFWGAHGKKGVVGKKCGLVAEYW